MVLLLRMRTGSRLYGLARPDSDTDIHEVYDHCTPYHKVGEEFDLTRWPLSKFLYIANRGGHNSLEMMFADREWPEVDLIADLRASYRTNYYVCYPRFLSATRTLRDRGDAKGEARAQMLEEWLVQIGDTGRFNPHYGRYRRLI